jgi:phosphoenolpyruvate carboxylase
LRDDIRLLDPLNHVQVEMLRRYRAAPTDTETGAGELSERIRRSVHSSIHGIAAALRNSG